MPDAESRAARNGITANIAQSLVRVAIEGQLKHASLGIERRSTDT
jgi:hypothetical protein